MVVAANGGSDLVYIPNGDRALTARVVQARSAQDYVSGHFVDSKLGRIPGTLPPSSIALEGSAVTPVPAIVVNFRSFDTGCADSTIVVIAAAQMLGGSLSSFARYEIYVLVLGTCVVLIAWAPEVNRAIETPRWPGCLGLLMLLAGYSFRTVDVVAASGNIYDQQYQMWHLVMDFWQRPYATNHPRLVAWRNSYPLLDLSGLDGHSAFAAQPQQPPAPDWPARAGRSPRGWPRHAI